MTHIVNRIHLVYLGLLPSLTTFFLVRRYGHRAPFALFIGGIIVTAVYLAASYSYTMLPSSALASCWALVDGPLFALVGRSWQAPAWTFIVEGFFIDAVALWLAILALCLVSPAPSSWQRGASFCLALIALASLLSLFVPYTTDLWDGRLLRLGWLLVGVVETTALLYRLLDGGNPIRPDVDRAGLYVAVLTVAWVIAMSAGMALHRDTDLLPPTRPAGDSDKRWGGGACDGSGSAVPCREDDATLDAFFTWNFGQPIDDQLLREFLESLRPYVERGEVVRSAGAVRDLSACGTTKRLSALTTSRRQTDEREADHGRNGYRRTLTDVQECEARI